MGFFAFKNKKISKKRKLYKYYIENNKDVKIDEVEDNDIAEKETDEEKASDNIPYRNATYTIAIAALDNKCGCTYIAKALYNYINFDMKKRVCIIDIPGQNYCNCKDFTAYNLVDICNVYDKFDIIILDVGNLNERTEIEEAEFKRANKKIIVSRMEDDYLRDIYKKIVEDKESVLKWNFVFNQVAPLDIGKVKALMENYSHYCLPNFYLAYMDKNTKKIINKMISD